MDVLFFLLDNHAIKIDVVASPDGISVGSTPLALIDESCCFSFFRVFLRVFKASGMKIDLQVRTTENTPRGYFWASEGTL